MSTRKSIIEDYINEEIRYENITSYIQILDNTTGRKHLYIGVGDGVYHISVIKAANETNVTESKEKVKRVYKRKQKK